MNDADKYNEFADRFEEEIAKEEGCKRVEFCCWSFNQNAMNMYKHMGYKEQRVTLEMDL